jgi:hypothetical protein
LLLVNFFGTRQILTTGIYILDTRLNRSETAGKCEVKIMMKHAENWNYNINGGQIYVTNLAGERSPPKQVQSSAWKISETNLLQFASVICAVRTKHS